MPELKPLNWSPTPGVGYTVVRRADGGMQLTFTDLSDATLKHWHDFSIEHLMGSDRLTRNLYDLRQVKSIPEKAIRLAIEVDSDPASRNIRAAVVVASPAVRDTVLQVVAAAERPAGAAVKIFTDLNEAEAWLSRPLDQLA
ncbi:MAG TPA: hypothetical protein VEH31_16165 [Streptosporangiaceae bacterium]|nr:hypothetical protein [Streptosporangiaceae bacterium]